MTRNGLSRRLVAAVLLALWATVGLALPALAEGHPAPPTSSGSSGSDVPDNPWECITPATNEGPGQMKRIRHCDNCLYHNETTYAVMGLGDKPSKWDFWFQGPATR